MEAMSSAEANVDRTSWFAAGASKSGSPAVGDDDDAVSKGDRLNNSINEGRGFNLGRNPTCIHYSRASKIHFRRRSGGIMLVL